MASSIGIGRLFPIRFVNTSAMPAVGSAEAPQKLPVEVQRCLGFGWVKFDTRSQASSGTKVEPSGAERVPLPEFRCAGLRGTAPVRRSREFAGTRPEGGGREIAVDSNDTSDETWALVCAGQLSMMPSSAQMTSLSSVVATSSASSSSSEVPGFATGRHWNVRCHGVSLRLDNAVADGQSTQTTSFSPISEPRRKENSRSSDRQAPETTENITQEWARYGWIAGSAIVNRADRMFSTLRSAASEIGPRQFATDTKDAVGRICSQSVKISKRSAEQVGKLASFPWQGFSGGSSAESDE